MRTDRARSTSVPPAIAAGGPSLASLWTKTTALSEIETLQRHILLLASTGTVKNAPPGSPTAQIAAGAGQYAATTQSLTANEETAGFANPHLTFSKTLHIMVTLREHLSALLSVDELNTDILDVDTSRAVHEAACHLADIHDV